MCRKYNPNSSHTLPWRTWSSAACRTWLAGAWKIQPWIKTWLACLTSLYYRLVVAKFGQSLVFFLETLTTEWQLSTRMTRTVFANLSERHISRLKLDAKLISWNVYAVILWVPAGECSTQQSQFLLVKAHRDPTGWAFKALCWGPVMTGHHGHQMDWSLVQIYQNGWCLSDSMGNSHHCWISKRNGHVMKHHCWIAHGDNMWNYVFFFHSLKAPKWGVSLSSVVRWLFCPMSLVITPYLKAKTYAAFPTNRENPTNSENKGW